MVINYHDKVRKIEPVIVAPRPVSSPVLSREIKEKDGRYVEQIVIRDLKEMDNRSEFKDTDFSLSAIIANDGVQALRDCGKQSMSTFDNIDTIDNVCETVSSSIVENE